MAGLTTARGLLIDRFHRGAIVMIGSRIFALSEEVVRVLEDVRDGVAPEADDDVVASLVEQGMLVARGSQ